jgi:hypothetical protein
VTFGLQLSAAMAVTGLITLTLPHVRSTLDGERVLPHRIHWIAYPSLHPGRLKAVEFVVDGKTLWVEHHPPYTFGNDGNYLVTSFLASGLHHFTVVAVATTGARAADTVTARVLPSPSPPAPLAGEWRARGGSWRLVVSAVGWQFYDPQGGDSLLDVAYLAPGLVEVRTGMVSGDPKLDLNRWCNDEPGSPARYRWSVDADGLRFTFADGRPCRGFTRFLTQFNGPMPVRWTRVG